MNPQTRKTLMSSASGEWETPDSLYDILDREFKFTVDVCATAENRKCTHYWDKDDDCFKQDWGGHICWMNPVYGKPEQPCPSPSSRTICKKKKCVERGFHINEYVPGIGDFIGKAYQESECYHGPENQTIVVALIPARTDADWWHTYVMAAYEVRFVKGRVKFLEDGKARHPAPFPSAIVVFRPHEGETKFSSWSPS